jgi:hypothetical protein
MDERRRKQILPINQPPHYGKGKEKKVEQEYASCEFCLHEWVNGTPWAPMYCPHCGRPYYGN